MTDFGLFVVVGLVVDDGEGAVELFCEDEANKVVGKCHFRQ